MTLPPRPGSFRSLSLVAALAAGSSAAVARGDPGASPARIDLLSLKDCGTYAATSLLRRRGANVTFGEVRRRLDPDGDGWCSAAEISETMAQLGHPVEWRRNADATDVPRFPCIMHFRRGATADGDHFAYVEPATAGRSSVFNLPSSVVQVEPRDLARTWTGVFAVPQGTPRHPAEPTLGLVVGAGMLVAAAWVGFARRGRSSRRRSEVSS